MVEVKPVQVSLLADPAVDDVACLRWDVAEYSDGQGYVLAWGSLARLSRSCRVPELGEPSRGLCWPGAFEGDLVEALAAVCRRLRGKSRLVFVCDGWVAYSGAYVSRNVFLCAFQLVFLVCLLDCLCGPGRAAAAPRSIFFWKFEVVDGGSVGSAHCSFVSHV
jgi:hypothetical protein